MTRQYIDKKNALHFRLVQKSVRDQAGEGDASERAFAPMNEAAAMKMAEMNGDDELPVVMEELDLDTITSPQHPEELDGHEAGEAAKYGIYYDDSSYDYTRHLKRIGEAPDAVFIPAASTQEVDATVIVDEATALNHATYDNIQELDIDPAVREVLDALDDEAFEDEDFEDDFVVKLNRDEAAVLCPVDYSAYREKKELSVEDDTDDDSYSDCGSLRGTAYAHSLAITSIDNKFDAILKMYDGEDDLDMVDLDDEDMDGEEVEEAMQEALDEFLSQQNEYLRPTVAERKQGAILLLDDIRKEMGVPSLAILNRQVSDTDDDVDVEGSSDESSDHFDCQSLAATLTNTENLPNVIREVSKKPASIIRLSRRTGMPIESGPNMDHTEREPEAPKENKGQSRSKDETAEEKKARKAAIKTERRENRVQKKELKVRFKLGEIETSRSRA
ncbi:hypothetical protein PSACC_00774 [Paramicrosporidium saccamoebae]|uniref:Low temperature viability protein n=1 Tax=Paramicrosporidium saccamoebae TaxID=1246581 RepID=A0A2H9TNZ1_9FUNG|nr:hypothetical protein PSACC_00774 [Paramicrosporidium saccamoebae]